ncbi:hypothetical protein MBLNU13_g09618t1 [Cladosporium sp. NU13]
MRSIAPILVLDTPRTFSHLFGKFFDAHPDLDYYYRPYFQVALNTSQELADGIKTNFPTECANGNESLATASQMTKDLKGTPAQATEDLLRRWSAAEQEGKRFFVQDHMWCVMAQEVMLSMFKDDRNADLKPWSSNPTHLPDALLEAAQVVILIRHPAKIVSSGAPVARSAIGLQPSDRDIFNMFTLRWARLMFDYLQSTGKKPIVVSGEDVVKSPESLLDDLSEALGIHRSGLRVSWPLVSPQERPTGPMGPWLKRVSDSTGVEREAEQDESPNLNVDAEVQKWVEEFGQRDANVLKAMVDADMPHYLYLEQQKIQVSSARSSNGPHS